MLMRALSVERPWYVNTASCKWCAGDLVFYVMLDGKTLTFAISRDLLVTGGNYIPGDVFANNQVVLNPMIAAVMSRAIPTATVRLT
jgi:hypothetical protein